MRNEADEPTSTAASVVFDLLDPVPYGLFLAALLFDATYARTAEILWMKSAAWLITIGLVFAVLPRLIELVRVWFRRGRPREQGEMASFWLHCGAIVAALVNAFVHSRDAYGVMPEGLWLSVLTVVLLMLARVTTTFQHAKKAT